MGYGVGIISALYGRMAVIYSAHQTSLNEKTKIDGTVLEALPDTKFKIKLDDGREILAYLAGKMRMNYIKVMLGDRVTVEIGPDENRGRIVYRK